MTFYEFVNIEATKEFVINVVDEAVDEALEEAMNMTAAPYPGEVDEFQNEKE